MDIYWYCPFTYQHVPELARAVMRPGDHLLAHLPARAAYGLQDPDGIRSDGYEVLRELPDVRQRREGSIPWLVSRMETYRRRAQLRQRRATGRDFDVAHVHFLNHFTDGFALRRLRQKVPLVSSVHDVLPHEHRVPRWAEHRLLTTLYGNAGTLHVAHRRLREQLVGGFHIDPDRVEVIPLPVPEVDLHDAPPDGPPTVLFFGTLRRHKGVPVLLRAIEMIGPSGPQDVRFHFAGRGASDVEAMLREAARKDRRIVAEIREIPDERKDALFRRATIVVLPYTAFTSQSGVLTDAYSYRVPVVATDVGAVGDTVREDGTGWVVAPGNVEALAAALHAALSDGDARQRAADAASRAAAARTYEAVGGGLRDLYEQVAGGR